MIFGARRELSPFLCKAKLFVTHFFSFLISCCRAPFPFNNSEIKKLLVIFSVDGGRWWRAITIIWPFSDCNIKAHKSLYQYNNRDHLEQWNKNRSLRRTTTNMEKEGPHITRLNTKRKMEKNVVRRTTVYSLYTTIHVYTVAQFGSVDREQ